MIDMTLEMAEKAVKAAQAKAKELGTPMSVSEVDESGRLVWCARGNGASFPPRIPLELKRLLPPRSGAQPRDERMARVGAAVLG